MNKNTKILITSVIIIICLVAGYFVYSRGQNQSSSNIYQNSKYGYEVELPEGWSIIRETPDKENILMSDNPNVSLSEKIPEGSNVISISLSSIAVPSNPSAGDQKTNIIKSITTNSGIKGLIREDSTEGRAGTVVALPFTSEQLLTGNAENKTPQSIVFLLFNRVDEALMLKIVNSFRKI